jgi:hypothetical protein
MSGWCFRPILVFLCRPAVVLQQQLCHKLHQFEVRKIVPSL